MDKGVVVIVVLVVIAIGAISLTSDSLFSLGEKEGKAVKIGAVLPLTGKQAPYGEGIMDGLELALEEINKSEEFPVKIELVYEDNAGNTKDTVSAVQKLINVDRVVALITGVSQHSMASAPIAEESQVVLYTMASQARALATAGDYVFKNDDDLSMLGEQAAEQIFSFGHKKVGVLFAKYNDATVDAKTSFVKRFEDLGGEVVAAEGFDKAEGDFRTYLTKIKAAEPTALFLDALMGDNVAILKQVKELGLDMKIFSNGTMESFDVIEGAGETAEGIVFFTFQGFPSQGFIEKTQAKYGHGVRRWSMEAYDGLKILATALSRIEGEITSDALKEELSKIREYDGESGSFLFDEQGNARRKIFVKKIENGKFAPHK